MWLDAEHYNCDLEVNMGWFHILATRRRLQQGERDAVYDAEHFAHILDSYKELLSHWSEEAKTAPANAMNIPRTLTNTSLVSGHHLVSSSLKFDSGFGVAASNEHKATGHGIRPLNSTSIQSIDSDASQPRDLSSTGSEGTIDAIPEDRVMVTSTMGVTSETPVAPARSASYTDADDALREAEEVDDKDEEIEILDDTITPTEHGGNDNAVVERQSKELHEDHMERYSYTRTDEIRPGVKDLGPHRDVKNATPSGPSPGTTTVRPANNPQSPSNTNPFVTIGTGASGVAGKSKGPVNEPVSAVATAGPDTGSTPLQPTGDGMSLSSSDSGSASSVDAEQLPAAIAAKPPSTATELTATSDNTSPTRKKKRPQVPPLDMAAASDRTPLVGEDDKNKKSGGCCVIV